jgi:peptide/nickel transport system substrate-binding protein
MSMSRSKFRGPLAAAVLVGALSLSACATSSPDASTPAAAVSATEGGDLTIALDRELPTLDVTNGVIAQQPILILSNALYEPLMTPGVGGAVEPGLAESLESDGTGAAWTLTIPEGVTFSDGSALTGDDVKAHIERLQDPANKASAAGQAAQITAITVVDDTTVEFTLAAPNVDFASLFARNLGMVASTEAVDEFGFPLGAGPYKVSEFVAGDSVTLVRNENYFGEPGLLDTATFLMMPDADSRYQSLQSGDVDLIWTEVTSQFQQARDDSALAVHTSPAAVSALVLNLDKPVFADVEVRTALAQAIDRDAVNAVVNLGEGVTVDSPYALLGDLAPEVDYPEYDVDAAAEVLEGRGVSFSLTVENRPDTLQRATAVQDMLGEVGVTVEIVPVESASFGATLGSGEFEAADLITSIFSDAAGGSLIAASTGAYNFMNYAKDTVDAALKAASVATESDARAGELATASQQLAEDLPLLWLTASNAGFISSADVAGIPDLTGRTLISVQLGDMGWAAE